MFLFEIVRTKKTNEYDAYTHLELIFFENAVYSQTNSKPFGSALPNMIPFGSRTTNMVNWAVRFAVDSPSHRNMQTFPAMPTANMFSAVGWPIGMINDKPTASSADENKKTFE